MSFYIRFRYGLLFLLVIAATRIHFDNISFENQFYDELDPISLESILGGMTDCDLCYTYNVSNYEIALVDNNCTYCGDFYQHGYVACCSRDEGEYDQGHVATTTPIYYTYEPSGVPLPGTCGYYCTFGGPNPCPPDIWTSSSCGGGEDLTDNTYTSTLCASDTQVTCTNPY